MFPSPPTPHIDVFTSTCHSIILATQLSTHLADLNLRNNTRSFDTLDLLSKQTSPKMMARYFMEVVYFILLYCWVAAFAVMLYLNPCLLVISFLLYLPTLGSIMEYALGICAIVFTAPVDNFDFVFPELVLYACLYSWIDLFMKAIPWDLGILTVACFLNLFLQRDLLEASRIMIMVSIAKAFTHIFPANHILFGLVFLINIQVQGEVAEVLRVINILGLLAMAAVHFQTDFFQLSAAFVTTVLAVTEIIELI